eukprot:SAG22_NODE_10237_length_546_cov_0.780761_2_plen_71_part_01
MRGGLALCLPVRLPGRAGDGTLNKVRRGDFATLGDSVGIVLADVDGDGDLDAIVANRDREDFLHLSDGSAS